VFPSSNLYLTALFLNLFASFLILPFGAGPLMPLQLLQTTPIPVLNVLSLNSLRLFCSLHLSQNFSSPCLDFVTDSKILNCDKLSFSFLENTSFNFLSKNLTDHLLY